jgi:putative transposase
MIVAPAAGNDPSSWSLFYGMSMARLTRLEMPLLPHLLTQAVRAGERLVRDRQDEQALLKAILDAARNLGIAVHAYVVLQEQICLLATPPATGGLSPFMQGVGRRYVPTYNRRHGREGGLWAGRYRCAVLDPAHYLLDAMVFIESHAWHLERHAIQLDAGQGGCASLGHHLGRYTDPLIQDHAVFWALGNTPFEREAAWRHRLNEGLNASTVARFKEAVQGGWALGGEAFLASIAQRGARRASPKPRGRPRKAVVV